MEAFKIFADGFEPGGDQGHKSALQTDGSVDEMRIHRMRKGVRMGKGGVNWR